MHIEIDQSPAGVHPSQVSHVAVSGSDSSGTFQALDPVAKLAASQAALALLGQLFPNAEIALTIRGATGIVLQGSKVPGRTPTVDLRP